MDNYNESGLPLNMVVPLGTELVNNDRNENMTEAEKEECLNCAKDALLKNEASKNAAFEFGEIDEITDLDEMNSLNELDGLEEIDEI